MQSSTVAEEAVWEGTPSQWLNLGTYLTTGLAAIILLGTAVYVQVGNPPAFLAPYAGTVSLLLAVLALVPLFLAVRGYLVTRTTHYELTSERILTTVGVFSRETNNLELYRVDDIEVNQPFLLRLVSRGNIVVSTSDRTNQRLVLEALSNSQSLRDTMRKYIEICRDRKRTRVVDMD
ncbi:MAG: PH domain-containing protein [Chloroflexota bacterium]